MALAVVDGGTASGVRRWANGWEGKAWGWETVVVATDAAAPVCLRVGDGLSFVDTSKDKVWLLLSLVSWHWH